MTNCKLWNSNSTMRSIVMIMTEENDILSHNFDNLWGTKSKLWNIKSTMRDIILTQVKQNVILSHDYEKVEIMTY